MLHVSTRIACSAASAILAFGIVAFADPANAASIDTEVAHRTVHVGDLDLASRKGRTTFDRRLAAAADDVCRSNETGPGLPDIDACRRQAIAAAHRDAGIADD